MNLTKESMKFYPLLEELHKKNIGVFIYLRDLNHENGKAGEALDTMNLKPEDIKKVLLLIEEMKRGSYGLGKN